MFGSERKKKRPDEHMLPRLRRKLPSIKFSAERGEISENYMYSTAARVIYSRSSCDGATHVVLLTLLRTICPTYSSIYSSSSSERATYTSMYRARARELLYEVFQSDCFFGLQVRTVGY